MFKLSSMIYCRLRYQILNHDCNTLKNSELTLTITSTVFSMDYYGVISISGIFSANRKIRKPSYLSTLYQLKTHFVPSSQFLFLIFVVVCCHFNFSFKLFIAELWKHMFKYNVFRLGTNWIFIWLMGISE